MIKTVEIGGREIILAANAATAIRYKQIFHEDLMKMFGNATNKGNEQLLILDTVSQLAFIMNKQAEKADMRTLTEDDFVSWLEDFEAMDIAEASEAIVSVYFGNQITTSKNKKK